VRQQPGAGFPTQRRPDPRLGVGEPARALGMRRQQPGQALGEGALRQAALRQ
jgi:hypothetical protein